MSTSPRQPKRRINPLLDELDEVQKPVAPPVPPAEPDAEPDWIERTIRAAQEKRVSEAPAPPAAPRWPMLTGIWAFPFYLNTLGAWMAISAGLIISGWLTMFWIRYGALFAETVFYLGLPALTATGLTLGYAASCCLMIVEETSYGWDTFEISPGIDWKQWVWNLTHIAFLAIQAGIVGAAVQAVSFADTWWPSVLGTLAAFPLVLLGALAAEGAWVPLAFASVLQSVPLVRWAWAAFFLETTPLLVGWTLLTQAGLAGPSPWLTPVYAGPLLAAVILIYARLIGRLAGCIRVATESLNEGDDDEQS